MKMKKEISIKDYSNWIGGLIEKTGYGTVGLAEQLVAKDGKVLNSQTLSNIKNPDDRMILPKKYIKPFCNLCLRGSKDKSAIDMYLDVHMAVERWKLKNEIRNSKV